MITIIKEHAPISGAVLKALIVGLFAVLFSFAGTVNAATTWTVNVTCTDVEPIDAADGFCDDTSIFKTMDEALAASVDGDTISLASDVTTDEQANLKAGMTLEGNGNTLTATFAKTTNSNNSAIGIQNPNVTVQNITVDGTGGTDLHGINVYRVTGVTLDSVTVSNFRSGVVVNGSNVTATDLNASGNAWNSVNVDPGSGVSEDSVFTLNSGNLNDDTQIWSDGGNVNAGIPAVTVNATGYTQYNINGTDSYLWSNSTPEGVLIGTVIFDSLQSAVTGATPGDTINVTTDITTSAQLDVNKSLTLDGNGNMITAGFSGGSVINILSNDVTLQNLTVDGNGVAANNRGINVYAATGVLLDNVVSRNNKKHGVVVNGSTVVVNNITTQDNGWGGLDVDLGIGVTSPASLTVNGVSSHTEVGPDIRIDDITKATSVTDTEGQYSSITNGNTQDYYLNDGVVVAVEIPAGTIFSGSPSWDGIVNPPAVTTATLEISGFDTTVTSAITIGSSLSDLTFDNAVRLSFAGQAGKHVGWYNHAGTFTEITADCSATGGDDETAQTAQLPAASSCSMDVGGDLVVWTKHFSTFVTYTQTAQTPGVSHGSKGSKSKPATRATPAVPGVSPALPAIPSANSARTVAAASLALVRDLGVGARGEDVTELQNRLIQAGVYSGPVTGYFGPLTQGAVAAYQRKVGIADTGYFGPLTRAEINKGLEMAESKVTNPQALEQIQSLQVKLAELMAKLVEKLKEENGQ